MDTHNASILDLPWNRAHFGAYSIVSSPLVLDLGALDQLEPVIPIITNPHALAVNQQWAGSPGRLLISIDPDSPNGQPDAAGFVKLVGALGPGHDMRSSNTSTLAEAVSTRILGRRTAPFPHLSLFLTAPRMALPQDPSTDLRRTSAQEAWCANAATCEGFTFDNKRTVRQVLFKDGMGGSTDNYQGNVVNRDPAWTTYLKYEYVPRMRNTRGVSSFND